MNKIVKRGLLAVGGLGALVVVGGGGFVWTQVSAYESSMGKVYDVPVAKLSVTATPEMLSAANTSPNPSAAAPYPIATEPI